MTGKRNEYGLTPKQEAFARAYVDCGNLSEAYRRSYDVGEDTKPETVWEAASRLGAQADVAARVAELEDAKLKETLRDKAKLADWVRNRLIEIATQDESDRAKALDLLGKHAAMFTERTEIRETVTSRDAEAKISELLQELTQERQLSKVSIIDAQKRDAVLKRKPSH